MEKPLDSISLGCHMPSYVCGLLCTVFHADIEADDYRDCQALSALCTGRSAPEMYFEADLFRVYNFGD
jgi:hypothetical protein